MRAMASRGMLWPVGLFGLVSQTIRVRSLIARQHSLEGKLEVRLPSGHLNDASADGVGARRVHVERRNDNDALRHARRSLAKRHHRGDQNALIKAVGQQQ